MPLRTFNQPVRHLLNCFSDIVIDGDIDWIIIIEFGTISYLCKYLRDLCKVLSSRYVNSFRHDVKCFWRSSFSLVSKILE